MGFLLRTRACFRVFHELPRFKVRLGIWDLGNRLAGYPPGRRGHKRSLPGLLTLGLCLVVRGRG